MVSTLQGLLLAGTTDFPLIEMLVHITHDICLIARLSYNWPCQLHTTTLKCKLYTKATLIS